MRFESKKEMAQALMDGRRFLSAAGAEIYFDPSQLIPFRCGDKYMSGAWELFACEWTEVLPWYENIPEHGVLCWVWSWSSNKSQALIRVVTEYDKKCLTPFNTTAGSWSCAEPITPEEAQQYIYQEPEK